MELKSISFLNSEEATPEFINSYVEFLVSTYGWEEPQIRLLLNEIKRAPSDFVESDFLYEVLRTFITESYNDITYEIIPTDKKFTTDDAWLFEWTFNSVTHALALTPRKVESLRVLFLVLDSGVTQPEGIITMQEHRNSSRWHEMARYLAELDIIGNSPIIPLPSDSLNMDESTARFSSAVWFEEIQKKTIILAGVGGIGSYVGFMLSRMKPKAIYIYDDDRVEVVNMAGQLFSSRDVMKFKVDALSEMVKNYSSYYDTFAIRERFTDESEATDIMICGFDNMGARQTFFHVWKKHVLSKPQEERKHCLYIDGRF